MRDSPTKKSLLKSPRSSPLASNWISLKSTPPIFAGPQTPKCLRLPTECVLGPYNLNFGSSGASKAHEHNCRQYLLPHLIQRDDSMAMHTWTVLSDRDAFFGGNVPPAPPPASITQCQEDTGQSGPIWHWAFQRQCRSPLEGRNHQITPHLMQHWKKEATKKVCKSWIWKLKQSSNPICLPVLKIQNYKRHIWLT